MTRRFLVYLDSDDSAVTYSCVHCRAHLADYRYLISKSFQGSQGRAYLFEKIVNVKSSTAEDRLLLTGHHRVADIYCICCDTLLGWKYEKAFEPSQRYKEGKYIIELIHIIKDNQWDTFLTPHTKRRSSGYSTEHFDNPGLAPLSQGACGQQNGGFVDSSTDLIEPALPSSVQGAAPCSSLPNPAHLSSAFAEPEESSLFNSDESPLAERLGQLQQTELSEPTVIPHADLIPRLIQQSALPQEFVP
uniref:Protein yippee-like 3 n=1 Tax=Schistocephalus solidus TaxID=70667 RepID=A0A0X3NQN8_SCHSO